MESITKRVGKNDKILKDGWLSTKKDGLPEKREAYYYTCIFHTRKIYSIVVSLWYWEEGIEWNWHCGVDNMMVDYYKPITIPKSVHKTNKENKKLNP